MVVLPQAEKASGTEQQGTDYAAPARERQTSRSTQQADTDAENAELQTPKLLSGGAHAPPDSDVDSASGNTSGRGEPALQSPSSQRGGADTGRGAGESDGLDGDRGIGGSMHQTAVDAESAALQLPDVAKAAQQVRVDEESAQLQKPETVEVVKQAERDAESEELQTQGAGTAAERPPVLAHSGGTGQMPKKISGKVNEKFTQKTNTRELLEKLLAGSQQWVGMQGGKPLTGYQKFLADMAKVREEQRVQKMERLCTGNPTYSLSEVCILPNPCRCPLLYMRVYAEILT